MLGMASTARVAMDTTQAGGDLQAGCIQASDVTVFPKRRKISAEHPCFQYPKCISDRTWEQEVRMSLTSSVVHYVWKSADHQDAQQCSGGNVTGTQEFASLSLPWQQKQHVASGREAKAFIS